MPNNRDRAALASMIYGEARNQDAAGKAAVGYTAMTRAGLGNVSVSDVVYGSVSPKYGQYSFANPQDPNARAVADAPYKDPAGWQEAVSIADGVISGEIENPVPGATNYQVTGTGAKWASPDKEIGTIGAHSFYALPESEVAGVVQRAANSPNRRPDLVDPNIMDAPVGSGLSQGLPSLDGPPRSISTGEFDFTSPSVETGFGEMNRDTRQVASEMARTLPSDQTMTMTATHGQHGLGNLTHTPGAAFDVRTRGLAPEQMDAMVDSALYSRPAAIGYNSGLGKFPAHMHVDTNAGYGVGLQNTSELSGLSPYAAGELARYDEEMKSGLGYTPPVPTSIAPVPQERPDQAMAAAAPSPMAPTAPEPSGLSGGLASYIDQDPSAPAQRTFDGVPVSTVKTTSFKAPAAPASTVAEQAAPAAPAAPASARMSYAQEAPAAPMSQPAAGLPAAPQAPQSFTPSATASTTPTSATASGQLYSDKQISDLQDDVADFKEQAGLATAYAPEEAAPETDLPAGAIQETPPPAAAPAFQEEAAPQSIGAPARAPVRIASPASQFPSAPDKVSGRASDVWGGKISQGIATDGSTLTRNPDGSVSRFSTKSGLSEKISDPISGFDGASFGDKPKSGGFWSGLADSVGSMFGPDINSMGSKSQVATAASQGGLAPQAEQADASAAAANDTASTGGTRNGSSGNGNGGNWGAAAAGGLMGAAIGGPVGGVAGGLTGFFGGFGDMFGGATTTSGNGQSQAEQAMHTPGLY